MTQQTRTVRLPLNRLRAALDVAVIVAALAASTAVVWTVAVRRTTTTDSSTPLPQLPSAPIPFDGSPTRGDTAAAIGVMEFSDFQCPYCAQFATDTLPTLVRRFVDTKEVLFIFRHLPLRIHDLATDAAQIAQCGARIDLFWPLHEALFRPPAVRTRAEYESRAVDAGLSAEELADCRQAGLSAMQVKRDAQLASSIGIRSTPTFVVGSLEHLNLRAMAIIRGAVSVQEFEEAIASCRRQLRNGLSTP